MNKVQRALITTIVYAARNNYLDNSIKSNNVYVECMSGAKKVGFKGNWSKNRIDVYEAQYRIQFKSIGVSQAPYQITIRCGHPISDTLKIEIPSDSDKYTGKSDTDYFEGWYTAPTNRVSIKDTGGKSFSYSYKIRW